MLATQGSIGVHPRVSRVTEETVAITRHGDTVGYHIPARRKRSDAEFHGVAFLLTGKKIRSLPVLEGEAHNAANLVDGRIG
jgi:hypothetical protein